MLNIYITRHGETEWNVERRMQGRKDSNLTACGIENAIALGNKLKDVDFNCIYSSSSGRAMHTSELIRGNSDIPIIPDDDLREIYLGDWEGKTFEEVEKIDAQGRKAFRDAPHLFRPETGESYFQVRDRIEIVLKRIINDHESGNLLIVTHAVIVKTIMSLFKNLPVEKLWEPPFVYGTSLNVVEVNGNKPTVLLEGDMSHVV